MNEDAKSEELWIAGQRGNVISYLDREEVRHGGVGEWPAFHIAPYLSLWAVQSSARPGWVGWWVISGDVPTDYINASENRHPREALRAIAKRWQAASSSMLRGEEPTYCQIGKPEDWPQLGDLLARRAALIGYYADMNELWDE